MKKLLIPKTGVKVRDPITGAHLPPEGAVRSMNSYYNRRINDGDLEIREVEVEKEKVSKKAEKKKDGDE